MDNLYGMCVIKKNPIFGCKLKIYISYLICLVGVFQQTAGILMGTNCAPLFANLFLYSYKADFIQGLLNKNEKKLARSFIFTFRYIDDVLSLNNSKFADFIDRIYPIEFEIKDPQIQLGLLHTWTYTLELTMRAG